MRFDHVVVWMDHHHAHIIYLDEHSWEATNIDSARGKPPHRHGAELTGRTAGDRRYFRSVCKALARPLEILLVGPSSATTAFMKFLKSEAPEIAARVLAVEYAEHATEMQLVDHARALFNVADIKPPPALS